MGVWVIGQWATRTRAPWFRFNGRGEDELGLFSILVYTLVGKVELLMHILGYLYATAGLDALGASMIPYLMVLATNDHACVNVDVERLRDLVCLARRGTFRLARRVNPRVAPFATAPHPTHPRQHLLTISPATRLPTTMSAEEEPSQSGYEDGHAGGPGAPTPLGALEGVAGLTKRDIQLFVDGGYNTVESVAYT